VTSAEILYGNVLIFNIYYDTPEKIPLTKASPCKHLKFCKEKPLALIHMIISWFTPSLGKCVEIKLYGTKNVSCLN
jgi:hypothetical protein